MNNTSPFEDFNDWFGFVIEEIKPALLVGVARGAVRLLQIQDAYDILGDIPVISDRALPFISDSEIQSKRILLFDDSVIFGSTLSEIREYLTKRGAVVFCASYVVARSSFYGETKSDSNALAAPSRFSDIPLRNKHRLWPDEIRRHHDVLIRSILQRPFDYNLDFPTFCFDGPKFAAGDIPYFIRLLCDSGILRGFFDVSSSISSQHDVYRYTAFFEKLNCLLFLSEGVSYRPYSKARVTFIPKMGKIRLTPIFQLSIADGVLYEDIRFADYTLQALWNKFHPPCHKDDPYYHQALFRLLTSFVAITMSDIIHKQFASALKVEFPVENITAVDDDVKSVIGAANSRIFTEILSDFHSLDTTPWLSGESSTLPDFQEPIDGDLLQALAKVWRAESQLKPYPDELIYEMLGKVFLTLRIVTDSEECRRKNSSADRLKVGLSYESIRQLLQEQCGIKLTPDDISLAIDICIDNGQAVPKVICQEGIWLRVFYSGEGEDSQEPMQFKYAMHKGYSDFLQQRNTLPLSRFDMHKLCATLKDLFPWLPISSRFYTFGKYSMVGSSDAELISWLADPKTGPLKIEIEEGRKILQPNEDFKPVVKPTWQPHQSRDFYDAFQYISTAFSKVSDESKVLLSTCRTHRHTYNAVAFEAHSWVGHDHGNFQTFLNTIEFRWDKFPKVTSSTMSALYWCIRYISEAYNKYDIFHRKLNPIRNILREEFQSQGPSAQRFWQYSIEEPGLLDDSYDEEIGQRFKFLTPLIRQMSQLTAFVTRAFIDFGVFTFDELQQKFETEHTSLKYKEFQWLNQDEYWQVAYKYNAQLRGRKIPGLSIIKTELPENRPSNGTHAIGQWCAGTLETVKMCFNEITDALKEFCPEYKVEEGDFPFSPDTSKRILSDGSIERPLHDIYLLTMDIIGSTDSHQTGEFKNTIIEIFQRFGETNTLHYEETGNDAFVVCSEDPTVLWDIACKIQIEGWMLLRAGGRFEGTRKGLSFGTVSIVENPDRHKRIKDYQAPHILSRAFSILDGVDACEEEYSWLRNSSLIMPVEVVERCAQVLKLNLENENQFRVQSKHFDGRCCIFDLAGLLDTVPH